MGESFRKHSNPEFLKNSNFKTRLFQIAFLVVCLIHMIYGALPIVQYFLSRNWSVIEGEILSFEIEYDSEGDSLLKVEYSFYFQNRQYRGNRYNFGSNFTTNVQPNKTYHNGQTVTIHFNPANPTDNVLNREIESASFIFLLLGIVIPISSQFWSWSHPQKGEEQELQNENDAPKYDSNDVNSSV